MQQQRKRITPVEWAELYLRQRRSRAQAASPSESLLLEVCENLIEQDHKLAGSGKKKTLSD